MAQIALVTFGSAGDVHPMLALARGLAARGHTVRLLTNPAFAPMAAQAGCLLVPVGEACEYEQTLAHPKLWHPVDGLGVMWRYLLRPALLPTLDALTDLKQRGQVDMVMASPVAFGARVFSEASGVPLVSLYTAATMLRSVHAPMTLAQWQVPAWMPKLALKGAWALLDRFKLEPLVRGAVGDARARAGLPPLASDMPIWARWMHSPQTGVTLFPDWFAPRAPDWPAQLQEAGFVLFDGDQAMGLPPGLAEFLAQGPAPVVWMPGTAMLHGAAFYAAAVQACRALGLRGVLLGAVPDGVVPADDADFWCGTYAPFGLVLPRAAALVHHGGIGSTAQALRAGLPQVVLAQAYDQFDNAMRVELLGVGRACQQARADQLQTSLSAVLNNARVAERCRHVAAKMAHADGLQRVCDIVDASLSQRGACA
jgi:rhamnosyltransferase subunit B